MTHAKHYRQRLRVELWEESNLIRKKEGAYPRICQGTSRKAINIVFLRIAIKTDQVTSVFEIGCYWKDLENVPQ